MSTLGTQGIRIAGKDDVPAMFDIRVSVRENKATLEGLHNAGIDAATVEDYLVRNGRGWVAEDDGRPVGFAVSDGRDGSVFALFVRPESEGKGFGSALLNEAVRWLIAQGFDRPWLEVAPGTRAHGFYLTRGWSDTGRVSGEDIVLSFTGSADSIPHGPEDLNG